MWSLGKKRERREENQVDDFVVWFKSRANIQRIAYGGFL